MKFATLSTRLGHNDKVSDVEPDKNLEWEKIKEIGGNEKL